MVDLIKNESQQVLGSGNCAFTEADVTNTIEREDITDQFKLKPPICIG